MSSPEESQLTTHAFSIHLVPYGNAQNRTKGRRGGEPGALEHKDISYATHKE